MPHWDHCGSLLTPLPACAALPAPRVFSLPSNHNTLRSEPSPHPHTAGASTTHWPSQQMPGSPACSGPYGLHLRRSDYESTSLTIRRRQLDNKTVCYSPPMHLPDLVLAPLCPPSCFPPLGPTVSPPLSSASNWNTFSQDSLRSPSSIPSDAQMPFYLLLIMPPHSLLSGQQPGHTLPLDPAASFLGAVSSPGSYIFILSALTGRQTSQARALFFCFWLHLQDLKHSGHMAGAQ